VGGEYSKPYSGGWVGNTHRFALRVYFEDTDVAQVVYYANYLKYMERARSDMLRSAGIDQRAFMDRRKAPMRSPTSASNITGLRSSRTSSWC
jgi:acyl-CoA thioester hydrolase